MALDGSEFFIITLLAGVIPFVLGVVALYWIIRLGVKHGMRSYYADASRRPGPPAGF